MLTLMQKMYKITYSFARLATLDECYKLAINLEDNLMGITRPEEDKPTSSELFSKLLVAKFEMKSQDKQVKNVSMDKLSSVILEKIKLHDVREALANTHLHP